jgi:hypothetical protein
VRSALDALVASGDLEPAKGGSPLQPADPLLALWVREKMDAE